MKRFGGLVFSEYSSTAMWFKRFMGLGGIKAGGRFGSLYSGHSGLKVVPGEQWYILRRNEDFCM